LPNRHPLLESSRKASTRAPYNKAGDFSAAAAAGGFVDIGGGGAAADPAAGAWHSGELKLIDSQTVG